MSEEDRRRFARTGGYDQFRRNTSNIILNPDPPDEREIIRRMLAKRYPAIPVTDAMVDAVIDGLADDTQHG